MCEGEGEHEGTGGCEGKDEHECVRVGECESKHVRARMSMSV